MGESATKDFLVKNHFAYLYKAILLSHNIVSVSTTISSLLSRLNRQESSNFDSCPLDFHQIVKKLKNGVLDHSNKEKYAFHVQKMIKKVNFVGINIVDFLNECEQRNELKKKLKIHRIYYRTDEEIDDSDDEELPRN